MVISTQNYHLISILFLNIYFISSLSAQPFTVNKIVDNGADNTHINIVFLGDGYTLGEMNKFRTDVQNITNDIMNETPFKEYNSYFNVYAIEVPSNESGTDHPGTATDCGIYASDVFYSDTYFESTFDGSSHRLLVIRNYSKAQSVLQDNTPFYDIVIIVVNHTMYGGSGGTYSVISTHPSSSELALHENGHSFSHLGDEYDYGGGTGFERPNTTKETVRELIKWNIWIDESTPIPTPETSVYYTVIGLFEGAAYTPTGCYRPKYGCMMKSLSYPFCEVCVEQTIIEIYNLLNTIETYQPLEPSIVLPQGDELDFIIQKKNPQDNTVNVQWYLDNTIIEGVSSDVFTFNSSAIDVGSHQLKVIATDKSGFVRNDPTSLLSSSVVWQILVNPPPCINGSIIYNTETGKFNFCEDGIWVEK